MNGKTRPRTAARVAAVQALFQTEQSQTSAETVVSEFIRHRLGELPGTGGFEEGRSPDADVALFRAIVLTTIDQQDRLDVLLAGALAEEWPLERLEIILRAIMRAGCYELSARIDVPVRVILNEYVEVAHAFFAGTEPAMVNGVLDRLAQRFRPDEMNKPEAPGGRG